MGRADYLALGDWNVVCFECGHKRKASQTVRNWQGYYVCPEHNEPRQPQDFVRGVPDNQTAPWVQPMPTTVYTYSNQFLGITDGITVSYQLGSGLYPVTVTGVFLNNVPAGYTSQPKGLITLDSVPSAGQMLTASGTETVTG